MTTEPTFLRSGMNVVEKANAELVLSYFKRWEGDFDPAAAYPEHFAPNARHRDESGVQSPVQTDLSKWHVGADAIVADAKMFIDMGLTAKALIHEVFASGPLVVVDRTDLCWLPGVNRPGFAGGRSV